jgi:hypothetical protein
VQADRLAVVSTETGEEGTVELRADSLNALGVESLLLGGTRTDDADGTNLDVTASEVSIDAGAEIELPELLLAARDTVRVESGASVTASGSIVQGASGLHTDGDGALLVASAGNSTTFVRSGATGASGVLDVQSGAHLNSSGALLLDASQDTRLEGALQVDGALTLGANRIGLGNAGEDFARLALSVETLAALGVDSLNLLSRAASTCSARSTSRSASSRSTAQCCSVTARRASRYISRPTASC